MAYKPVYTPVFSISLKRLYSFLSRNYSKALAEETKTSIRAKVEKHLINSPFIGPVCNRLLELGVPGYRQLLVDEHNMVIYKIDEERNQVVLLLVFDTRQSLEKLLNEVNLTI